MARVALFCRDLLFGSRVDGALRTAGHQVALIDSASEAGAAAKVYDVLVVDLTDEGLDGAGLVESLGSDRAPALGFYSHVDQETRKRAEAAGFERVVPRSRMAREAASLVEGLVAG